VLGWDDPEGMLDWFGVLDALWPQVMFAGSIWFRISPPGFWVVCTLT
jgi:hypothetical protein